MTIDELIRNLKTYEIMKQHDKARSEPNKENNLVLKYTKEESGAKDDKITYITIIILKIIRRIGKLPIRGESSIYNREGKVNDTCHKYGKLGHFIKDCPLYKVKCKDHGK